MAEIDATEVFMDDEFEKIILSTYNIPRTPHQISDLFGIPIARCFEKVKKLEKMGVLNSKGKVLTKNGKQVSVYQSNLEDMYVFLDNGKIRVRFEIAVNMARDFKRRVEETKNPRL